MRFEMCRSESHSRSPNPPSGCCRHQLSHQEAGEFVLRPLLPEPADVGVSAVGASVEDGGARPSALSNHGFDFDAMALEE